jgi:hypothetical protein
MVIVLSQYHLRLYHALTCSVISTRNSDIAKVAKIAPNRVRW